MGDSTLPPPPHTHRHALKPLNPIPADHGHSSITNFKTSEHPLRQSTISPNEMEKFKSLNQQSR
jgi:hypothetical protein